MAPTAPGPSHTRPPSPTPSQLPPIPGSPTFTYASTANRLSTYTLPIPPPPRPVHAILTKADLEASQIAYSDLLTTAKAYRQALASLSVTASAFGASLEACARLKEARADALGPGPGGNSSLSNSFTAKGSCTADLLLSASGVHHLVANHQQILSETVYRSFEVPLLHELDKWRGAIEDEDEDYKREVAARSKEIRKLEKEGLRLHKQRRRDVGKFREHLVELTTKLDGLTTLHGEHASTMLRESQETSEKIVDASCSLVRAEVDIFESLARKGWSGGGLDELLEKGKDLFANDEETALAGGTDAAAVSASAGDGARLFSILPPKSILADSASGDSGRPGRGHGRADSLLVETDRYQSLAGAVDREGDKGGDTESIFSDFNQTRGVRPFSPQPIRRLPTDVILDPDSLLIESGEIEGAGARDVTAQELHLDEEHEELFEEAEDDDRVEQSPWNDVVRGRKVSGETVTDISTAKDREQRWSNTESDDSGTEQGSP